MGKDYAPPARNFRVPVSSEEPKKPRGRPRKIPATPNIDIPNFDEWEDFIGSYVLRWLGRAYVAVALRGIDREIWLSPEDEEDLELSDTQTEAIARPFAKLALQSKFLGKHGRAIMNSKDAIEASVVLFMYTARVRRIGKRIRKMQEMQQQQTEGQLHVVSGGSDVSESESQESETRKRWGGQRPVGYGFN